MTELTSYEIERLEAQVVELEYQNEQLQLALALVKDTAIPEIERLREELHYCKGTCDLAMQHRDIAEAEIERLTDATNALQDRIRVRDAALNQLRAAHERLQAKNRELASSLATLLMREKGEHL